MYKSLSNLRKFVTWSMIVISISLMTYMLIVIPYSSDFLYLAMVCACGIFVVRCVATVLELWQEQNTSLKIAENALQIYYKGSLAYTIPYEIIKSVQRPKNLKKTTIQSTKFDYPISVDESACEEFYKELEQKGLEVVEAA